VVEAGNPRDPLLILLHGFPEFWWAWRKQITPLAEAGYYVVVPDMRGYNTSDAPRDVSAYDLDTLAADVIELADAYGLDRFRLVGHDWVRWCPGGSPRAIQPGSSGWPSWTDRIPMPGACKR
jgi:pimeloyl-ACP methyl ester carboxylesterase